MNNGTAQYFGKKIIPLMGAKITEIADGGEDECGLIVQKTATNEKA